MLSPCSNLELQFYPSRGSPWASPIPSPPSSGCRNYIPGHPSAGCRSSIPGNCIKRTGAPFPHQAPTRRVDALPWDSNCHFPSTLIRQKFHSQKATVPTQCPASRVRVSAQEKQATVSTPSSSAREQSFFPVERQVVRAESSLAHPKGADFI